jgi:hypothetical protein
MREDLVEIAIGQLDPCRFCELSFEFPQTMPMIATLNVHFSRVSDLELEMSKIAHRDEKSLRLIHEVAPKTRRVTPQIKLRF